MGTLYLFALVVGVGVVLVQLLLSSDSADADAAHPHAVDDALGIWLVFRLRFWTFALLGFGLLGTFLHFSSPLARWATACAASAIGLFTGWIAVFTFEKLSQKSNNSGAEASELVGQLGRVLLPVNDRGLTKVRLRVKGQLVDYVASGAEQLSEGSSVLVEEVRGNTLQVSAAPSGLRFNEEE